MSNNTKMIRKLYGIAGASTILAVPYIIMLNTDNKHLETAQSLCPFKMLTGFPCPGCGITKSLIFLYQGNLLKSISYHLFGPATFLFCIVTIVVLTTEVITRKKYFRNVVYSTKLAYVLGITLAAYHLSRLVWFISANSIDDILRQSIWK